MGLFDNICVHKHAITIVGVIAEVRERLYLNGLDSVHSVKMHNRLISFRRYGLLHSKLRLGSIAARGVALHYGHE
jgi:hypothetical protein